jgi:transcriptional regulator with XRE-family HTH domain
MLAHIRRVKGHTQSSLARATGVSQSQISAVEKGKLNVSKKMAAIMAEFFDIDVRVFQYAKEN